MMHSALLPPPVDLGIANEVDPFAVQPGVILFDRFCVLGRVHHSAESWWVLATDLERRLGHEPHHRIQLHHLPLDHIGEGVIGALWAHQVGSRRVLATLRSANGLLLAVPSTEASRLAAALSPVDARSIARTLVGITLGVHRIGVTGLAFDRDALRIDPFGQVQFGSWRHLRTLARTADRDAEAADEEQLRRLLRSFGVPELDATVDAYPSLDALYGALRVENEPPAPVQLPALAPFVGRQSLVLRLQDAMGRARHDGPHAIGVVGPPGSGKTRLGEQLVMELLRWDGVYVLAPRFNRATPTAGIDALSAALGSLLDEMPLRERTDTVTRIRRAVGPLHGMLSEIPALAGHFRAVAPARAAPTGPARLPPPLPLEEGFIRHTGLVADAVAAVGTPGRPVLVLVDDLDQADGSVRAVVRGLLAPGRRHHTLVVFTAAPTFDDGLPIRPERVELPPLAPASLQDLVEGVIGQVRHPESLLERLLDASGGQPGPAWATLRSWLDTGVLRQLGEGRWVLDAESNVVRLGSDLAGAGPEARDVALMMALGGASASPAWIVEVCKLSTTSARAAIDELVRAGLVIRDWSGELVLPDEPTRERILQAFTPTERATAHARLGAWYAGQGESGAGQVVWHVEHARAPGLDPGLAGRLLDVGVAHLSRGDSKGAEWYLRRALARTDDAERITRTLDRLADALLLQERVDEAVTTYLTVLDRLVDPAEVLRTVNRASHGLYLRGRTADLVRLGQRALAIDGGLPQTPWQAVRLLAGSFMRTWFGRWSPALRDEMATLHVFLASATIVDRPEVGMSSVVRALLVAWGQVSGPAARARGLFAVPLAGVGLRNVSDRLLAAAEIQARAAGDIVTLGLTIQVQAQNAFSTGNHGGGMSLMGRALTSFRSAGDLSMAVPAIAVGTFYCLDREATHPLLDRLADLEFTVYRQRSPLISPVIDGMRLYVRARGGGLTPDQVSAAAAALPRNLDTAGLAAVSLAALALLRVDRAEQAAELARWSRGHMDRALPLPFVEVVRVADTACAVVVDELAVARKSVRRLRRRARAVPAIRVATQLIEAQLLLREGDTDGAVALATDVVERASGHGESWHVRDAHLLLASLLGGRDPVRSRAHAELAATLGAALGCVSAAELTQSHDADRAEAPSSRPEAHTTEVDQLLLGVVRAVDPALPPGVRLVVRPAERLRAAADSATLELLIINMVLLARDAMSEDHQSITLEAERVGATDSDRGWVRIGVSSHGTMSPAIRGAIGECRYLAERCGGGFQVDDADRRLELQALVPAATPAPAPQLLVVVVHRDGALRQSLVQTILQYRDWTVLALPPGEALPEDAQLVLLEDGLSPPQRGGPCVVRIGPRGAPAPAGLTLRVPYLVAELEALLAAAEAAAPTAGGWPSG